MTYRVVPRLSLGVEFNPKADELGPLANWVAVRESAARPALMFGLSSDRIGTPEGEAYFFTLSKDLSTLIHVPVSCYAGASYGTFESDLRAIGGLRARLWRGLSMTALHDGEALHPSLEYMFGQRHTLSLLWIDLEEPGIAYSVAF